MTTTLEQVQALAKGLATPLTAEQIKALFDAKLITKQAYLQVALAMEHGALTVPDMTSESTQSFAQRRTISDEPRHQITPSDMRKVYDKIQCCLMAAEEQNYPQLNLF